MPEASFRRFLSEQFSLVLELARWIPVAALVGIMAGTASALLLVSLTFATNVREHHRWLILLLGPAGGLVGLLYQRFGASVEAGNNLILEQTHDPTATIPLRMTPLILLGTFLTHLFGGSAGREGTAIQTGASLADQLARPFRMIPRDRRILLMAGISAGFGSVFGTPLAGAVFGIEVLAIGTLSYEALAPCLLASFVGDLVTHAWGVHHTIYRVAEVPSLTIERLGMAMVAGILFGLLGMSFAKATHAVSHMATRYVASAPLRPVLGGLLITAAAFGLGLSRTSRYLGLGIPTIVAAFTTRLPAYDFVGKLVFTAVTLGTGFKGGEVTPLFYIGASSGNALSRLLPLPPSLLAGMGFAAVFAGAANTPIASTLLAVELFGAEAGAYAGIACVMSYLFSGHTGIYHAQRIGKSKHIGREADEGLSLALAAKTGDLPSDDLLTRLGRYGGPEAGAAEGNEPEASSPEANGTASPTILRLYFAATEMRQADTLWNRFAPQSLGAFLLQQAKEHGIDQAILYRVIGGYLKNEDLAEAGSMPPAHPPQCLELVGKEQDLQSFLEQNRSHLAQVRTVFLRGARATREASLDKTGLAQNRRAEDTRDADCPQKADSDERIRT